MCMFFARWLMSDGFVRQSKRALRLQHSFCTCLIEWVYFASLQSLMLLLLPAIAMAWPDWPWSRQLAMGRSSQSSHYCGSFLEEAPFFRDLDLHKEAGGEANNEVEVLAEFARYFNKEAPTILPVYSLINKMSLYQN